MEEEILQKLLETEEEMEKNSKRYSLEEVLKSMESRNEQDWLTSSFFNVTFLHFP